MIEIVIAYDSKRGIGRDNQIPWRLPPDLRRFKAITLSNPLSHTNAVIMGRRTFDSLPPRFRPLPNRLNIVLSRQHQLRLEGALVTADLDSALTLAKASLTKPRFFVIGGAMAIKSALMHPLTGRVFATAIRGNFNCDTFLPPLDTDWLESERSALLQHHNIQYEFITYERSIQAQ